MCECYVSLVPTAPPQEVEVVAVNSTTIRFTWSPPPQQFINGINQGYKVSLSRVADRLNSSFFPQMLLSYGAVLNISKVSALTRH